jgi:uncharacterized protein (DUF58 family)
MTHGVIAETNELIALQALASRLPYKPKSCMQNQGNHVSRLRGRGMEFAEVRNYQAGDDIRHMDWRVTARTGHAHVKVYEEEKEQAFVLLVDFSPSMYFGTRVAFKSVTAARLAALLAWNAVRQGDRVGALLFSSDKRKEFTPKAREAAVLPLLASMSDYTKEFPKQQKNNQHETIRFSDELLRLRRISKPGSKLILISDFYQMDADCIKHLTRLAAHNDLIVYHVCDALELAPPKPGMYPISNGNGNGSNDSLLLNTKNFREREAYQSWCDERISHIKSECLRLRIRYIPVLPDSSLVSLVSLTGRRKQRV